MQTQEIINEHGPIEWAEQVNIDTAIATAANKKLLGNILIVGMGILAVAGTLYVISKTRKPLVIQPVQDKTPVA